MFPSARLPSRIFRREPLFMAVALVLLALAIGALGAMLALYRGTLAQPPPLAHWERLVVLRGFAPQAERLPLSYPDFEDLRRDVPALEDLALTRAATVTMEAGEGLPQRIAAARVTPNLAAVLGVALAAGPGFDVAMGQPADQVIVSDRLWRGVLSGGPIEALQLRIGGRAVEVVGVLPPGLRFPTPDVDLWLPLAPAGNEARRDYAFTTPWGVLRRDSDIEQARRQIAVRVDAIAAEHPQSHSGLRVEPFPAALDLFAAHRPLIAIFALVGVFVCVAVAGNVMALAAARELARRGDSQLRLVLGASGRHLLLGAVRTAVMLLAPALALGAALAWTMVRVAEAADAETFTALRATIDGSVVLGTLLGALLLGTALVLPTLWTGRTLAAGAGSRAGSRSASADRLTVRGAGIIVALQLAMCFAATGTLVLARAALASLEQAELGFAVDDRYSAALGVPEREQAETVAGFEAAIGEVERIAGVDSAAAVSRLPLLRGASSVGLVPSSVGLAGDVAIPVDARLVVGPADEVLGLRLRSGRFLDDGDREGAEPAVVVDQRFAEQWLPGRDAVGARIRLQIDPGIEWLVVGVIDPVQWRSFENGSGPSVLMAAAQFANIAPMRNAQLVWRGGALHGDGVEVLRGALRRGMPLLSADTPRALSALVDEASGQSRMAARLLQLLAAMAMALALVGVGALLLYRQERQRHATGIRICLGASRRRVVSAAFADAALLACCGALAGAVLLLAVRRAPVATQLLAADGTAMALQVAAGVIAALAVVGAIVPAWRIAQLRPADALRRGG